MIHILDAMTAKPGRLGEVRQLLRERYLPGARARGMRLLGEWVTPVLAVSVQGADAERRTAPEELILLWSVDDVADWWDMRAQAGLDPAVPAFWREVDARLEARTRRMLPVADESGRSEPLRRMRLAPDAWRGERVTAFLTLAQGAGASARLEALARALPRCVPGCLRSEIGRNLAGTLNGGDYTLDLVFEDAGGAARWLEGEWSDGAAQREFRELAPHIDACHYAPLEGGLDSPDIASPVKRTLLLRVEPGAPPEQVARFERELAAMPDHIPAIRNWHLARVAGTGSGRTHVWAQEFEKLDGLQTDYMVHPYHWAIVDRWFDPESPERIVAPDFSHVFCTMPRSVLV